jgi:hypothetical protein
MADIYIIFYKNIIRNVSLLVIDNYDLTTGETIQKLSYCIISLIINV